jgi:hypothetical protein
MVVLLLNGAVGYWDELAIALVALAVLWIAVKLAGRNPAKDDEDDTESIAQAETDEPQNDPTDHPSKKTG